MELLNEEGAHTHARTQTRVYKANSGSMYNSEFAGGGKEHKYQHSPLIEAA